MGDNESQKQPWSYQPISKEEFQAVLETFKAYEGLDEKLKGAADTDAVVTLAEVAGFLICAEELNMFNQSKGVSDEELASVAGG